MTTEGHLEHSLYYPITPKRFADAVQTMQKMWSERYPMEEGVLRIDDRAPWGLFIIFELADSQADASRQSPQLAVA